MEKICIRSTMLAFFLLSIIITACQQDIQPALPATGTVRIVLAGNNTRNVDAAGLPIFDESNTKITVTETETGTILPTAKEAGTEAVTLTLSTGTKITVKAVVTTAVGRWRGSKDHIVESGVNTVSLKLSKAPKGVANVLFSTNGRKTILKLEGSDEKLAEVSAAPAGQDAALKMTRDGIGRIYVLDYKDASTPVVRRFTAEGNEDTDFNTRTAPLLTGINPTNIAADTKTNELFVFTGRTSFCIVQEQNGNITRSEVCNIQTADPAATEIQAAAAYSGTLFVAAASASGLRAYTVSLSGTSVNLTAAGSTPFASLGSTGVNADTAKCTALLADSTGMYCLLASKETGKEGLLYAVGKVIRYEYTGSGFTLKYEQGLTHKAIQHGGIDFDTNAFSYPAAFIGYDEETLYIADDGIGISTDEYIDWKITGNKNRIAACSRNTGALSFDVSDADGTWTREHSEYPAAKIPRLLWENQAGGVTLKLETQNGSPKTLVEHINTMQQPKIMTARDSTGSVYVLYHDSEPHPQLHLERFTADGTKDGTFGTAKSGFSFPAADITDIAVDFKTAALFLLKRSPNTAGNADITVYMATPRDDYASFSSPAVITIPDTSDSPKNKRIDAVAAFDNTLFFAMPVKPTGGTAKEMLYAYKRENTAPAHLAFSLAHADRELTDLRPEAQEKPRCTGIFADRHGVYCLLSQKDTDTAQSMYALGQLVQYNYDGNTALAPVSLPANGGLYSDTASPGSILFKPEYFSQPAGFIGYDGDSLAIADDGIKIEEIRENIHVNGNSDRIITFNRKDGNLHTQTELTAPAWLTNCQPYTKATVNTPILLWQHADASHFGMCYWASLTGTDTRPTNTNLVYQSSDSSIPVTDIFCYDQDGNLYILWSYGTDYYIKRFEPDESSYCFPQAKILKIGPLASAPAALAADISGGTNYLYAGYKDGSSWKIVRWKWTTGNYTTTSASGNEMPKDNTYTVEVQPSGTEEAAITALAANKDGLYVGIQKHQATPAQYQLSVKKYSRENGSFARETAVGTPQPTVSEPAMTPFPDYHKIDYKITALQIADGVLYGITVKTDATKKHTGTPLQYRIDAFQNSSVLYKIGSTATALSSNAQELAVKNADDAKGSEAGYGFYRFVAVRPEKLVIASDGAFGTGGTKSGGGSLHNTNKVLEYDLKESLLSEVDVASLFSMELKQDSLEFTWKTETP